MKKWIFLVASAILGLLMVTTSARACEPCMEILNMDDTAAEADLIVIGRLVHEGPSTGTGPDWIEITVLEVWKGELDQSVIRVNSWDGMCAYGIILLNREPYLIFLEKEGDYYDSVFYGCSVRSIPVQDDQIEYQDTTYSLDEAADLLGLTASRQVLPPIEPKVPWTPVVVGVVLILGMTVGFYLVLKRLARP